MTKLRPDLQIIADNVASAVAKGLSVVQGDADTDLAAYPDASFDYAVLSQTLQTTRRPDIMLDQLLRIGRQAFVSFPNFAHWRIRMSLLLRGRMPVTRLIPQSWYDTPNIHHVTIEDFRALVSERRQADQQGGSQSAGRTCGVPAQGLNVVLRPPSRSPAVHKMPSGLRIKCGALPSSQRRLGSNPMAAKFANLV